ncbi:MAG: SDR family NAD(P)-dependent oxidoreductase, partial [Dehalococcoidia bacterium]
GKVAIVTGANHGIGAATAQALAAQGVAVFITYLRLPLERTAEGQEEADAGIPGRALYYRQQARSADDDVAAIRAAGGSAAAWEADLTTPATLPELFDRAESALGPIDILVNNAAHCEADTFLPVSRLQLEDRAPGGDVMRGITAAAHDQHFAVNSRAVALLMAEFARRQIERDTGWGRIVNVSTDGASAFAGEISYGASKHALESYSRAAAVELGPFGITVNVVSLGPVQTGYITPEMEARVPATIPLRRLGQPEDAADVILFLASEQARWVTGQLLYVGGGHVMPL